ncbi:MAG: ABC transporter ATP-binding protein [Thermovirgaceae bacterium]
MSLLEIQNITKKFGSLVANDSVSFSIEQGQIVGLIGPNGAGKTTLFNCISGFYKVTDGQVLYNGEDVTDLPAHRMTQRGAVRTFQVVHPFNEMSVLDNVLVGAFLRVADPDAAYEAAKKCITDCHLEEIAGKQAGDLTIGQKKRLEVARALATDPKLLMLDEAMAGLTTTEIREAVDLIRRIRDRGVTLLVVEHIMEAIMPIADKVIVLDGGVKIADGPPEEIINDEQVIKAYFGEKYSRRIKEKQTRKAENNE